MRFKPWMLAPKSKAKAGPWSALPSSVLAALTSADPSPMVRNYLLNRAWPGAAGTKPALHQREQAHEPQTNPQPEIPPKPSTTDEPSSLSLTIRVVQPMVEEPTLGALAPKPSRWSQFFKALQRRVA